MKPARSRCFAKTAQLRALVSAGGVAEEGEPTTPPPGVAPESAPPAIAAGRRIAERGRAAPDRKRLARRGARTQPRDRTARRLRPARPALPARPGARGARRPQRLRRLGGRRQPLGESARSPERLETGDVERYHDGPVESAAPLGAGSLTGARSTQKTRPSRSAATPSARRRARIARSPGSGRTYGCRTRSPTRARSACARSSTPGRTSPKGGSTGRARCRSRSPPSWNGTRRSSPRTSPSKSMWPPPPRNWTRGPSAKAARQPSNTPSPGCPQPFDEGGLLGEERQACTHRVGCEGAYYARELRGSRRDGAGDRARRQRRRGSGAADVAGRRAGSGQEQLAAGDRGRRRRPGGSGGGRRRRRPARHRGPGRRLVLLPAEHRPPRAMRRLGLLLRRPRRKRDRIAAPGESPGPERTDPHVWLGHPGVREREQRKQR